MPGEDESSPIDLGGGDAGRLFHAMREPGLVAQDGYVVEANAPLLELLSLPADRVVGGALGALFHREDGERAADEAAEAMRHPARSFCTAARLLPDRGAPRSVDVAWLPVTRGGRPAVAGLMRDITDRVQGREVEAQLRQTQRMEAVGQLAGGVAHDMNNVLGAIMGFASVLQVELPCADPLREDVGRILEACRKGRNLTLNLLGFARRGKYRIEQFTLNERIAEVVELLSRSISKRVRIVTELSDEAPPVDADAAQIHQAVLNVCLNAVDAMPGHGVLTLTSDALRVEARDRADLPPGRYARLVIRDSGPGMDEAVRARAFEPFFTTKPVGQGSGLGLSMVHGTVENHGGAVALESRPGAGTAVTILLPSAGSDSSQLRAVAGRKRPSDPSRATILVVDDEPLMRASARRLLEKLGFRALLAADGPDALRRYAEERERIAAVVLDLVMPEMDGGEVFRRLREIDPDVRVLLASGYSREEQAEELIADGADGFLQKPFDLATLRGEMRRLLD